MAKENKATFTYTTLPSVREKARKKAEKEGYSLSVKIDMMLREYIRVKKRKPPKAETHHVFADVYGDDGHFSDK